jgi:hypothetical protein
MAEPPATFATYLEAWNEPDVARVRDHLERAVAPDVVFVDPANSTRGIDELETLIREARTSIPTGEYGLASGIDGHNDRYRYRWEVRIEGAVAVTGMDVTTVDEQGRLERIDGFFGDFPPLDTTT